MFVLDLQNEFLGLKVDDINAGPVIERRPVLASVYDYPVWAGANLVLRISSSLCG